MKYYKAKSNECPKAVDITSSPTTVYLRKNIVSVQSKDETEGNARTEYHYDEAAITKDEYIDMLHGQIADVEEVLADILFGGDEE